MNNVGYMLALSLLNAVVPRCLSRCGHAADGAPERFDRVLARGKR